MKRFAVTAVLLFVSFAAQAAYMNDFETCEWNPGSHRYTGNATDATAKANMPASTRAKLNEMMANRQWTDVVTIRWGDVHTKYGENQFGPDISNMNFAEGRICKKVTRAKWTVDHEEDALVYVVDGRAFGWAAACGNFFELPLLDRLRTPPVALYEEPAPLMPSTAVVPPMQAMSSEAYTSDGGIFPAAGGYVGSYYSGGGGFFGGGGAGGGGGYLPCDCVPPPCPPVAAVPEPSTWALFGLGLISMFIFKKRKQQ